MVGGARATLGLFRRPDAAERLLAIVASAAHSPRSVVYEVADRSSETQARCEAGRAHPADPDPERLFEWLHATYPGFLEPLVLADTWGLAGAARRRLLAGLLGRGPRSSHQASVERRWLVALGLLEPAHAARAVTPLGRQVLAAHAAEVIEIRKRIEDLLEQERETDLAFAEAMEDVCGEEPAPCPRAGPAERAAPVALTAARIGPHVAHLELPGGLLDQIGAALSSGKHLLLVGPPGTGKTELALGVSAAAAEGGHCHGTLAVTASADWTTYETIGGYALARDGSLLFRSGVLLAALEQDRWLVVDELNRADVDRAFGELLTVLAGRGVCTPFTLADGRRVSIAPDEDARGALPAPGPTHRMPSSFRLIATMNTWDRAALFRLSYALQRRFAILQVDPPDDAGYARLLDRHACGGADPPLDGAARATLGRLFASSGLLAHRSVGPAVALDLVRYARRRASPGEALAEAFAMLLLPQLEGLAGDAAAAVASMLDAELAASASVHGRRALRARLRELFPELRLDDG